MNHYAPVEVYPIQNIKLTLFIELHLQHCRRTQKCAILN